MPSISGSSTPVNPESSKRPHPNTRHGMSRTPMYGIWHRMIRRCTDSRDKAFRNYGGRGIKVCERWTARGYGFDLFLADVGMRPSPELSLDRINNDGDYEPGNVRWATKSTQNRNTRHTRLITWNGRTASLAEWSEITGLPALRIGSRLHRGWSIEKTLSTPADKKTRYSNRPNARKITFNGATKSLSEWSRQLGISMTALSRRIREWGIERALAMPLGPRAGKRNPALSETLRVKARSASAERAFYFHSVVYAAPPTDVIICELAYCSVTMRDIDPEGLLGLSFGKLTVRRFVGKRRRGTTTRNVYECDCICGGKASPTGFMLKQRPNSSCGCARREILIMRNTTHGLSRSPEYRSWADAKTRATNPNVWSYVYYGGRGIGMCQRYQASFVDFLADLGRKPEGQYALDRIDNNRGYDCGKCEDCRSRGVSANCRWATYEEQSNNRDYNHRITIEGVTRTLAQWSRHNGVSLRVIYLRLGAGWDEVAAVSIPSRSASNKKRPPSATP